MSDLIERLKKCRPEIVAFDTEKPALGTVYMKSMTGAMRMALVTMQNELQERGRKNIPPALVVAVALCKEDGAPAFDELADGMLLLQDVEDDVLMRLYNKALEVTGLGKYALENAEKKSSGTQSSETGTSSASSSEDAP